METKMMAIEVDEGAIPVTFQGEKFIWLKNRDGSGPNHVDETGGVKAEHIFSDSFAHVFPDGTIMRYRNNIGTVDDLGL